MGAGRHRLLDVSQFVTAAVVYRCASAGARPPRVAEGAEGYGGGSADTPGHGLPMQQNGHRTPVAELTELPSWDDFYTHYVRANRPVVFRGAGRSQRAFKKWTDEYLVGLWGSRRKVDAEIKKIEERGGKSIQMPFDEFAKEIYKVSRKDELYAVIGLEDDQKALVDIDFPEPARCKEIWPQSVTLWMSAGGTMSVLHNDDAENFLILLDGTKELMLVHQDEVPNHYASIAEVRGASPVRQDNVDLVNFPRFANVSWQYGEMHPGDMVFIPHTYWHQVNSVGRNLGINIWWQHREDFRWFDLDKYSALKFGTPDLPPFDEFKSAARPKVRCTALPSDHHMGMTRLVDERDTKRLFHKYRSKKGLNKQDL